ncbi:hypothetical protein K1T71_015169 [Dendrolimus kikuchii]|nr:hypothetical protein K1T71_015169 [Dendrolimus kikuchii]
MPKVSKGGSYTKKYTEEDIIKAIEAVRNGMPKKTASTKFGVPRPTLQFRLSSQFVKSRPGPTTILTEDEEKTLVEWIITCSRKGFPRRKEDILLSVEQFLTKTPRPNCFINNKPGEGWYRLFLKRYPDITTRTAEAVTAASANISESNIRQWFRQIEQYLKDSNLFNILCDGSRVFNGDETNFQLCPKNTKVLAEKGCKNVYEVDHAQAKSCLTVMFTFSASSDTTPPMVIYPLKRMQVDIRTSVPSHWGLGLSDNGWMNKELFFQYINNVLYPYLLEKKIQFPIVLFIDGHKSHMNYELSESCKEKGIILIALYPNATRILQPADVSAFKPMKNAWKKSVLDWRRKNLTKILTKINFGPIFTMALEKYMNRSSINGFKACGLYPWNPNAIDFSKCLGKPSSSVTSTNQQSNSEQQKPTMVLEKFQEIVGPSILKNLQPHSVIKNPFQDSLIIVYNFFKLESTIDDRQVERTNIKSPLLEDVWIPEDNIPVLMHTSEDLGLPNSSEHTNTQNNEDIETVSNPNQNINIDTPILFDDSYTVESNLNHDISILNENVVENLSEFKLIDSFGSGSNAIEIVDIDCQTESPFPYCSTSLPIFNNVTELTPEKVNLKNSLLWPKTPARKGRQIENKPVFVLTSNK